MVDVDDLDCKILKLLQEDGRTSFTTIAEKLKFSESTIRKRVQGLQKRGVIKKFTVEIAPFKIGIRTVAIVGVDVDPTQLLEASQKLCEIEDGNLTLNTKPAKRKPVAEYLKMQGRFSKLTDEEIQQFQVQTDQEWEDFKNRGLL